MFQTIHNNYVQGIIDDGLIQEGLKTITQKVRMYNLSLHTEAFWKQIQVQYTIDKARLNIPLWCIWFDKYKRIASFDFEQASLDEHFTIALSFHYIYCE